MGGLLKDTFKSWKEDDIALRSAALSYYTVFSLSPLLVVLIAIAGIFLGKQATHGELTSQLRGLMGDSGANLIDSMIAHSRKPSTNIITSIIGIITLLLGAGGVFGQLKQALNHIWHVKTTPRVGFIGMLRDRFLSFSMIGVVGFLLIISLAASAVISSVATFLGGLLPISGFILEVFNFILSLLLLSVAFTLVFKILPDVKTHWRDVWYGGIVTAVLFTIGKTLIGLYVGHSSISSTYGAAASLAIILIWVYYAGQIFFFGSELTKIHALRVGHEIIPSKYAELTDEEKEVREEKRGAKQAATQPQTFVFQFLGGFFAYFLKPTKKHR